MGSTFRDMAIVIDFGTEAAAYPVPLLQARTLVNDVVAGVPVAIVTDPVEPDSWVVFSRVLDDQTVTLAVENGEIVDVETGTVWDPVIGRGISGPAGRRTTRRPACVHVIPERLLHLLARRTALGRLNLRLDCW